MNTFSLVAATIMAGVIAIAGGYERAFNMPKWFANPPVSFSLINKQSKNAQLFWIPVQILFIVSFIIATITNWQFIAMRLYLIIAFACFLLVVISTVAYFLKEILAFSKMPAITPVTPVLQQRADQWLRLTTFRNILQFISLVMLVIALSKS